MGVGDSVRDIFRSRSGVALVQTGNSILTSGCNDDKSSVKDYAIWKYPDKMVDVACRIVELE